MAREIPAGVLIGALVATVHGLRPTWDKPGIRSEVEKHWGSYAPGLIAAAAIDAAITTSTLTPAGIGSRLRDGWGSASHGWTKDQIDASKPTKPTTYPRCQCCKSEMLPHAGVTREEHHCPPYVIDRETGQEVEHHCQRQPERGAAVIDRDALRAQLAAATQATKAQAEAARAKALEVANA